MAMKKKGKNKGKKFTDGNLTRRERRKLIRKDQRLEKKLKKKLQTADNDEIDFHKDKQFEGSQKLRHESKNRKNELSKDIVLKFYKGKLEAIEHKLRYKPLHAPEIGPQNKPLTGAARPAREVYPEYYPEVYEEMKEKEKVIDLLEEHQYNLSSYIETFDVVRYRFLFAVRLIQYHQTNKATKLLTNILENDDRDSKVFRSICLVRLVWIKINKGELLEARKLIEQEKEVSLTLKWDLFLIEYISCYLLQENTSEEKVKEALVEATKSSEGKAILSRFLEVYKDPYWYKENEAGHAEELSKQAEQFFKQLKFYQAKEGITENHLLCEISFVEYYIRRSLSFFFDADDIFSYLAAHNT